MNSARESFCTVTYYMTHIIIIYYYCERWQQLLVICGR